MPFISNPLEHLAFLTLNQALGLPLDMYGGHVLRSVLAEIRLNFSSIDSQSVKTSEGGEPRGGRLSCWALASRSRTLAS